jgi:hypothetical protein
LSGFVLLWGKQAALRGLHALELRIQKIKNQKIKKSSSPLWGLGERASLARAFYYYF